MHFNIVFSGYIHFFNFFTYMCIHLFEMQNDRERVTQRICYCLIHSQMFRTAQTGQGQNQGSGTPTVMTGVKTIEPLSITFSVVFIESWIGSGVAKTQIKACRGCCCCRLWFNLLYHNTNHIRDYSSPLSFVLVVWVCMCGNIFTFTVIWHLHFCSI